MSTVYPGHWYDRVWLARGKSDSVLNIRKIQCDHYQHMTTQQQCHVTACHVIVALHFYLFNVIIYFIFNSWFLV